MKKIFLLSILLLYAAFRLNAQSYPVASTDTIFLSQTERELIKLINEYRAEKGLSAVELSHALCVVARTHAQDQSRYFRFGKKCNMHSWSDNGKWLPCCYTPDQRAQCMWDKPRELTSYPGNGYEISFYSTFPYTSPSQYAKDILDGWKKSPNHNNTIINRSIWKVVTWKAIGVGIYGNYANVWFGKEPDTTAGVVQ